MPTIAPSPDNLCTSDVTAPASRGPSEADLSCPLLESKLGKIASQLAAGYGSDAITLSMRRASVFFEKGDAANFADWCLVILALGELERLGGAARR